MLFRSPSDEKLDALAAQLVGLRKRTKALGVFANDRELMRCPRCGLLEDVTSTGLLITCRAAALGEAGVCVVPLADDVFRCRSCAQRVEVPAAEINILHPSKGSIGNEYHQPERRSRQRPSTLRRDRKSTRLNSSHSSVSRMPSSA